MIETHLRQRMAVVERRTLEITPARYGVRSPYLLSWLGHESYLLPRTIHDSSWFSEPV